MHLVLTMSRIKLFLLIQLSLCHVYHARKLPEQLDRCSKSDKDFSKCFLKAVAKGMTYFQEGDPDYGLPKFEPLLINSFEVGSDSDSAVNIKMKYSNLEFYGMGINAEISPDFEANFVEPNCYWRFSALSPSIRMTGEYSITGQLMVFPLNGHGMCSNVLSNMFAKHEMHCQRYQKRGKQYLNVTSYKLDATPAAITFDFQNIIDGNEQLSKTVVDTMNENALNVYKDIKQPFDAAFAQIWRNAVNGIFAKVPEEELFLP